MSEHRGPLESALMKKCAAGRRLLVPYVTGAYATDWLEVVRAVAAAGADAIEIGIPFSDPVMDGPVIQAASVAALARGATPFSVLSQLSRAEVEVPLVVMSYLNPVLRAGYKRMANQLASSGVAGAVLPDLPVDEADEWLEEASAAGVDAVQLAAPTSPDDRIEMICAKSRGFVYAIGTMGVTGERSELAASAVLLAARVKQRTELPVLVGVGVSSPEQAREIVSVADGVIVGSALMRRMLDGEGSAGAGRFVEQLRAAIDS